MRFDVFTIFPEVFDQYLQASIIKRAREKELLNIRIHNIRDWASDRHRITDDAPYGGGGGMIMKPEPIFSAVESVLGSPPSCPVILLTPQGEVFTQKLAHELIDARQENTHLGLICGRYEGVDERVRQHLADREISIGDYVLTGGELPAMVLIDVLTRLIPGSLGDPEGEKKDSHSFNLLEHPHYTRPNTFRGWEVPEILLSGDHARIERWRRDKSIERTLRRRPDLLENADLSNAELAIVKDIQEELNRSPDETSGSHS